MVTVESRSVFNQNVSIVYSVNFAVACKFVTEQQLHRYQMLRKFSYYTWRIKCQTRSHVSQIVNSSLPSLQSVLK